MPHLAKKMLFYYDNALVHTSTLTTAISVELSYELRPIHCILQNRWVEFEELAGHRQH